jgi:1-deoxy-D-xylulose 5-phosphate reductoisomerase
VIEQVLQAMPAVQPTHFEDLFAVDAEARRRSEEEVGGLARV